MALSRDEIVTAALLLLDEHGLDGLSLRRLAGELGVSAPTLYWHIRDKRELLDLVSERMISDHRARQPAPHDSPDRWEQLADSFRQQYYAIIAHRDGARVFAGNRPTEAMLPMIEHWLGLWTRIGFSPGEALTSIISLGNYVLGAALEYEAERARAALPANEAAAQKALTASFPNMARAAEARRYRHPEDHHSDFEHGLMLLIDGLKARHASLARNGKPIAEAPASNTPP